MADRRRTSALAPSRGGSYLDRDDSGPLTASARIIDPSARNTYVFQYESWQDELWDYLDTVGEFGYAHWWKAQAISRVRLIAAEKIPGQSEPRPIETGPAADIMSDISTSEIMEAFGLHIPLVGKCFLLGKDEALIGRQWSVRSADEIRRTAASAKSTMRKLVGRERPRGSFELQVDNGRWETLDNALVSEIKHNHPRYGWRSISSSKSAIPILREISLYDKHIIATLVSRLAMNGMIFFPEGMTFPANPIYKDAPDPFIAEWIDIASRNIRNPGSAGAALPYPLRIHEKFIDKIKHFTFASAIDPKIIAARKEAVTRLATTVNVSRERVTGMGVVNQWGMTQLNEDEVNTHIVPTVELIAAGVGKTYLKPMLLTVGEPLRTPAGNEIIAWYDTGELTQNPDLSKNAEAAFRDGALKRLSYLKHLGFEAADMATGKELEQIILLRQALAPGASPEYLAELTGTVVKVDCQGHDSPTAEDELEPEGQTDDLEDGVGVPSTNVDDEAPTVQTPRERVR